MITRNRNESEAQAPTGIGIIGCAYTRDKYNNGTKRWDYLCPIYVVTAQNDKMILALSGHYLVATMLYTILVIHWALVRNIPRMAFL